MGIDRRKYLRKPDAGPRNSELDAFEFIVERTVKDMRNKTRGEVNLAIYELEKDPDIRNMVGDRLITKLKDEIEKRLEE